MSRLRQKAYCKLILHAAKHPARPVMGLLLGTPASQGWEVVDSAALFHNQPLAPMLELAFLQADEHCKHLSKTLGQDVQIVGCYFANERYEEKKLSVTALKISNKVAATIPNSVVLVVDNQRMGHNKNLTATIAFTCSDRELRRWKVTNQYRTSSSAVQSVRKMIQADEEQNLRDFEEHLEDPKSDWFNGKMEFGDEVSELTDEVEDLVIGDSTNGEAFEPTNNQQTGELDSDSKENDAGSEPEDLDPDDPAGLD